MVTIEELTHNPDFYICSSEAQELISDSRIRSWKYGLIKLGKIRRWKDHRFCSLKETVNYRFLQAPESEEAYRDYLQYSMDPSNRRDNPERSPEMFLELRDTILQDGYDPRKGIIVIDQYHTICVGLHRACILLEHFGENFRVPVLKVNSRMSRDWFLPCLRYELTHLRHDARVKRI